MIVPEHRTALQATMAQAVVVAMHAQHLNQVQLAERAGVTPTFVSRLLSGRAEGSLTTWEKLLRAAGLTVTLHFDGWRVASTIDTPPGGRSRGPTTA